MSPTRKRQSYLHRHSDLPLRLEALTRYGAWKRFTVGNPGGSFQFCDAVSVEKRMLLFTKTGKTVFAVSAEIRRNNMAYILIFGLGVTVGLVLAALLLSGKE